MSVISRTKKLAYTILGLISAGLGIIGIWVPGLPTTIFILLALWAFSRSSTRLRIWLVSLPLLRPTIKEIERFERERTIDPRVKVVSQSCSWLSALVVLIATQSLAWTLVTVAAAISCSVFMFLIPSATRVGIKR